MLSQRIELNNSDVEFFEQYQNEIFTDLNAEYAHILQHENDYKTFNLTGEQLPEDDKKAFNELMALVRENENLSSSFIENSIPCAQAIINDIHFFDYNDSSQRNNNNCYELCARQD